MNEDLLIAGMGMIFIGAVAFFINAPITISIFLIFLGLTISVISLFEKKTKKTVKTTAKDVESSKIKEQEDIISKILEIIKKEGEILQTELIEKLNLPRSEVYKILEELENSGKIKREKQGRTYKITLA